MQHPPHNSTRDEATPELALAHLRGLAAALTRRGFTVRVDERSWSLAAKNEAAAPEDPLARTYGPVGLSQRVRLAADEAGTLCWYWAWSGPTRTAPPEYQLLGPAADLDQAADRIARVIALTDQPTPAGPQ